jgi:hypothetical protein
MSKNDVTGDNIITKVPSPDYLDGWERIFGKKTDDKNSTDKATGDMELHSGQVG